MPLPRPPSADPLVALADQCVQCGLCLPACPTYRRDGIEAESPRGRIALARGWALEALEPTPVGDDHLDRCLGCRSCEAACPAGVRYGALLVEARRRQRARRRAGLRQRLLEALAARPRLLALLMRFYAHVFPLLPTSTRPLPRPPGTSTQPRAVAHGRRAMPAESAAHPGRPNGPTRAALFVGCAARAYEPPAQAALAKLLAACGVTLDIPDGQTCCGALHAHAGAAETASRLGRRNEEAFIDRPLVLTLASGCHEAVAAALPVSSSAVDAIDHLADCGADLRFRPTDRRVALHLPCTQRNVVRSVPALHRLLARVPGVRIIELDAGFGCCGASGTTMLTDPDRAASFRAPLVAQLEAAGVDEVLSANLGCRLHLAGGTSIAVRHPLEFLADHLDGPAAPAQ